MGHETVAVAEPGEPPEDVRSEVLWRLAARLYRDHARGSETCAGCRQPWPCSGRRLAVLGLGRAATGWSGAARLDEPAHAG
jgi:hypothetical protein